MFFPYDDINPSHKTPYITASLVGMNVLIFLAMMFAPDHRVPILLRDGGLIPADPETLDFLTSMFLHGGFWHLAGNMMFLWITGDNVEEEFGGPGFLGFYLFAGGAAALAHIGFAPNSTIPLIGASGAVSGVLGVYYVLYPNSRIKMIYWVVVVGGQFEIRAGWWLGIWFVMQLVFGLLAGAAGGGVAYAAHIAGFVVGLVTALVARAFGWADGEDDELQRRGPYADRYSD